MSRAMLRFLSPSCDSPAGYLVMDYFDGVTLADHVARNGPLTPESLVALARPVAEALQAAHGRGILHRDIKPANLLVRQEGSAWRVKVIDFGLALGLKALQSAATTNKLGRTVVGSSIAGTPDYAPPEQLGKLTGVPVGRYSDIYSFATPRRQVGPDHPALVRPVVEGVVAADGDHLVVPERPPQVVQVPAEQPGRPPLALPAPGVDQPPGPPVQAPGRHPLLVVPRRVHGVGAHRTDTKIRARKASRLCPFFQGRP